MNKDKKRASVLLPPLFSLSLDDEEEETVEHNDE